MQGIYVITNQISGCSYVGQSSNIEKRLKQHFSGNSTNKKLWKDIQLLGSEMFNIQCIDLQQKGILKLETTLQRKKSTVALYTLITHKDKENTSDASDL